MRTTFLKKMAILAGCLVAALAIAGCGAIDAALGEGQASSAAEVSPKATHTKDSYLEDSTSVYVGISPDPSGSLALPAGEQDWGHLVQESVANAIAHRLPAQPADDAGYRAGASGIPELHLIYMPVADNSGEWRGAGSSLEIVIPEVPTLLPEPQPDQEDDVLGPGGRGEAWEAAREAYKQAHAAAERETKSAAEEIAAFPLVEQRSDIFGSVGRLAERLGAPGKILILSDLEDTQGSVATRSLEPFTVVVVQACTGKAAKCTAAAEAFSRFVVGAGGEAPKIVGHESVHRIINEVLGAVGG